MDSGATAKWIDLDGTQCGPLSNCPTTHSLEVQVLPAAEGEPDDTEPVHPAETPTPEPVALNGQPPLSGMMFR
jgi:hypothetical protein